MDYYEIGQRIRKFRKAHLGVRTDDLLFDSVDAGRNAVLEELFSCFNDCSPQQLKVLNDIVTAAKTSIRKYL